MRAAVLGTGLMGSVISRDLAASRDVDEVVVVDIDQERLEALRRNSPARKLTLHPMDIKNQAKMTGFLKGFDVVVSALPHGIVHPADLAAVDAGAKMVNIAFEDEQMELDARARKNGALLVPGCGLAPGLGGILLAAGSEEVGGAKEGHIMVGGVPENPKPPFNYRLLFSIIGLLREYTDEARVFRAGRVVRVKPFNTVEAIGFPEPIGRMEAFCTDGLASLVYTMKGMEVLDEKTLRWPGHVEKMNVLLESGFFSREKLKFGDSLVSPIEMSWAVLGKKLSEGDPHDITVMRVIARKGKQEIIYDMVDRYDRKTGVTSMGKTTGYTGSIVAQMVGRGEIKGTGVLPPESGVTGRLVEELVAELARRGVRITKTSG